MINRLVTGSRFTHAERSALESLRTRYQSTQDLFTAEEMARLRFLRWLVHAPTWNRRLDREEARRLREHIPALSLMWMSRGVV